MDFKEFMRVLEKPYWCPGSPLDWHVNGMGIAHYAMDGRVGMFNLSWFVLQQTSPPQLRQAYRNANMQWIIRQAGETYIEGKSLLHHASVLHFERFRFLIYRYVTATYNPRPPLDIPGAVPWKTLYNLSMKQGVLK